MIDFIYNLFGKNKDKWWKKYKSARLLDSEEILFLQKFGEEREFVDLLFSEESIELAIISMNERLTFYNSVRIAMAIGKTCHGCTSDDCCGRADNHKFDVTNIAGKQDG